MRILHDLLETLTGDHPVASIAAGVYITCVHGKQIGLASTFRDVCGGKTSPGISSAGHLEEWSVQKLAHLALSDRLLDASLGMAALNAGLPIPEGRFFEMNARELICEKGRGKRVAVVGDFPFIDAIRDRVGTLHVIQRPPHEGIRGVMEARDVLPSMDVVAITGSSFINHTFQSLLELSKDAYVIVLGATTPISTVLFDYGVDAICGTLAEDGTQIFPYVMQGGHFRRLPGVRRVTFLRDVRDDTV